MAATLTGIRIVSTALNLPGPVAVGILRDMGAAIVKVEPPAGDPLALAAPGWYAALGAGVEVIPLDLKSPEGGGRFQHLLEDADLLLTANRPAALKRLGLSWPDLHGAHPRLCHVAIVGYPAPRQDAAGHDLTYQAAVGLLAPPAMPRTFVADLSGAQRAVIAALDLLLSRERIGRSGYAEVALSDCARLFAEPPRHGLTSTGAPLGGGWPVCNVYQTRDGWVAVAGLEPHFQTALARELCVNVNDRAALARVLQQRSAIDWERWADERGLPIAAVR